MTYPTILRQIQNTNSALLCAQGHTEKSQYDPSVPDVLRCTQEWMARKITAPLTMQHKLVQKGQGPSIQEEASQWLRASPNLAPHQCLELYAQQYWWRLLRVLEDQYPLTRRILGGDVWLAQVAVPYLAAHVPRHWSLFTVDDRLLEYLQKTPCGAHPAFTYDAACLDYANLHLVHLAHHKPLSAGEGELELLFSSTLYTQPHIFLLEFPGDLISFRKEVLRVSGDKKDYYMNEPLPALDLAQEPTAARCFVLFREQPAMTVHVELSFFAARYLRRFIAGSSIEDSLEWVETQEDAMQQEVNTNLAKWLEQWVALGWLTLEAPK